MHNDHRSHNQRRSYDRASQGDRNAQGGARQNRGPRTGGKSGDFRKGGKPGGFRKDSKPGGYRKDDRGPRDGKPGGYRKDGKPGGFRKDDRGPRDEQRSGADRKDFRARDGKPTGGSAPRKDFSPRTGRGPRRDSREAGHPREVFIDGKLMAAPDQDAPQDRGPRFDGPRDGGRGGAPRRGLVRRQKAHKATTARELALAAIHQLRERDAFAQDIIAKTIDISPLSREDRAFATRLVLPEVVVLPNRESILLALSSGKGFAVFDSMMTLRRNPAYRTLGLGLPIPICGVWKARTPSPLIKPVVQWLAGALGQWEGGWEHQGSEMPTPY